jgi:two-component system chemotaxis sensor kinase CheA
VNLEKYRSLFVEEASEHLAEMSRALLALEKESSAEESAASVDCLFRVAHSIKGMAASLDYGSVSSLAHSLEDWLEPLRRGAALPDSGFPLLYTALGALEEMVGEVARNGVAPPPRSDLLALLEMPHDADFSELLPSHGAKATSDAAAPPPLRPSVRVRTEAIDRFLAAVGEVMQRHARLETLYQAFPLWEEHREFTDELDRMAHVVRELRRRALDIRTTPVRRVLERLPRVVSELARELGKRVQTELSGEEIEVDCAVLDHLDDPLLHLVRNAVDHGIETPDQREAAGKPPLATLRIAASRAPGRVRIRIEDDGRGIDVEGLRRRAVERRLMPEAVAEDLPIERLCELIFEPGMSTRDEVTAVSGRGVGLDAVRRTVQGLGGSVGVQSTPAQGTCFEVELPSMVALQRILVLEVGGERVAVPVARVECVLGMDEGSVEGFGPDAFFVWHEEPIPLLDLGSRIGLERRDNRTGNVVVLEAQGFRLGLRVDRAGAELEVFVREVPPALRPIELLGGVAILPDGAPVFLLEVGVLTEDRV